MQPTEGASHAGYHQGATVAVNLSGTTDSGGRPWLWPCTTLCPQEKSVAAFRPFYRCHAACTGAVANTPERPAPGTRRPHGAFCRLFDAGAIPGRLDGRTPAHPQRGRAVRRVPHGPAAAGGAGCRSGVRIADAGGCDRPAAEQTALRPAAQRRGRRSGRPDVRQPGGCRWRRYLCDRERCLQAGRHCPHPGPNRLALRGHPLPRTGAAGIARPASRGCVATALHRHREAGFHDRWCIQPRMQPRRGTAPSALFCNPQRLHRRRRVRDLRARRRRPIAGPQLACLRRSTSHRPGRTQLAAARSRPVPVWQ